MMKYNVKQWIPQIQKTKRIVSLNTFEDALYHAKSLLFIGKMYHANMPEDIELYQKFEVGMLEDGRVIYIDKTKR